ncbi:MAG: hypothetical protein PHQ28_02905, partial [Mycobacterium sp.]|nr:hypothetical protein [Mycobacterium sp.]
MTLRAMADPLVAAAPSGARVRTRLRVNDTDAAVLTEVGGFLGSLAGRDLAARCREGRLHAEGKTRSRQKRKKALTDFLGASLAIYGGVSPSGVSAGVARRSEWSGLAVDVLLDDR